MTNPGPWHGSGDAEHRTLLRHGGHPPEAVLSRQHPREPLLGRPWNGQQWDNSGDRERKECRSRRADDQTGQHNIYVTTSHMPSLLPPHPLLGSNTRSVSLTFHIQDGMDKKGDRTRQHTGNFRTNPVFGALRKLSPPSVAERALSRERHLKSGQSCWRGVQEGGVGAG